MLLADLSPTPHPPLIPPPTPHPLQLKAWCYYESRLLGAHHGLISSYALEVLVLHIFNLHHAQLHTPLDVRRAAQGAAEEAVGGRGRHCRCLWLLQLWWQLPCSNVDSTRQGFPSTVCQPCLPRLLPAFPPCRCCGASCRCLAALTGSITAWRYRARCRCRSWPTRGVSAWRSMGGERLLPAPCAASHRLLLACLPVSQPGGRATLHGAGHHVLLWFGVVWCGVWCGVVFKVDCFLLPGCACS
jgi:hypothetical protein